MKENEPATFSCIFDVNVNVTKKNIKVLRKGDTGKTNTLDCVASLSYYLLQQNLSKTMRKQVTKKSLLAIFMDIVFFILNNLKFNNY